MPRSRKRTVKQRFATQEYTHMRSEADTPVEQRFLMVLGRLSEGMVRQLEEEEMPLWLERARGRGEDSNLAPWERFSKRDRSQDHAFYTLYAYADIPLGRRYDCVFQRDGGPAIRVSCRVDHAVFEGGFPTDQVEHGHKHVVFLSFDGPLPKCIPTFQRWEEVGQDDWQFALCDHTTYDARKTEGEPRHATDG